MKVVVGIDLGTTTSYIAYVPIEGWNRQPTLVPCDPIWGGKAGQQEEQEKGLPSRVFIKRENRGCVELRFDTESIDDPEYWCVSRFKPFLGMPFVEVGGKPLQVSLGNEQLSVPPEVLAAFIVNRMLEGVVQERRQIVGITVGVPAMASMGQRAATRFAVCLGGWDREKEVEVLEEPVAAFMYHFFRDEAFFKGLIDQYVLVIDFGGGTCDLSLILCKGEKQAPIVRARRMGLFGGEDVDELIARRWLRDSNIDYDSLNPNEREKIRKIARDAKETLSRARDSQESTTSRTIGYIGPWILGQQTLTRDMLRAVLEEERISVTLRGREGEINRRGSIISLVKELIDDLLHEVADEEGMGVENIRAVILAGGSTHLREVHELVRKYFGDQIEVKKDNPEKCVASGAALYQYWRCKGEKRIIIPTLPWDIQLEYCEAGTQTWRSHILGKRGEALPLDAAGFLNERNWVRVKKASFPMKIRIRRGSEDILTEKEIAAKNVSHLWTTYYVDESGVIRQFRCKPAKWWPVVGSPLFSTGLWMEVVRPADEEELVLSQFDPQSKKRIQELLEIFCIRRNVV